MTDWNQIFSEYINKFSDVNTIDEEELKNTLQEYKDNNEQDSIKLYKCMYNSGIIKSPTKLVIKVNINTLNKNVQMTISMNDLTFVNKINQQINNIFNKSYIVPKDKYKKSIKINNIEIDKINFFLNYNREYIKVNPEEKNIIDIKYMLNRHEYELLFYPVLSQFNNVNYLSFKIKGIIIHIESNTKYIHKMEFIKRVLDAKRINERKLNRNKEQGKDKEKEVDKVFIESKFNTYKVGRNKINNSNKKLISLLSSV